jgi:peptidyl-prolyl cis-trans isomerase D
MKINNKTFNQDQFNKMGQDITQSITLNSIKDNNRFNINAVELLYSLPINSFTLINDDESKIYLAKIIKFEDKKIENDNENYTQYIGKQNTNNKTNILQSYDIFLNDKYDVVLNQQTIKRVKNFFQ